VSTSCPAIWKRLEDAERELQIMRLYPAELEVKRLNKIIAELMCSAEKGRTQ
jgi:hypothetical protein